MNYTLINGNQGNIILSNTIFIASNLVKIGIASSLIIFEEGNFTMSNCIFCNYTQSTVNGVAVNIKLNNDSNDNRIVIEESN